jgi:hypothetical protein
MSNKQVDDSEDTGFEKKWDKVLKTMPEMKDTLEGYSPEELKKAIMDCENNIYETDKVMLNDSKLNAAKELVKDYSSGYNEAKKVEMCKIKYSLFLLKEKGNI